MPVEVSLTDPTIRRSNGPHSTLFASEVPADDLDAAARPADPEAAIAALSARHRSSAVTGILGGPDSSTRLVLALGMFGSQELFFVRRGDTWFVTDHFHSAVSQVPVSARRPSDLGLADHYLFGHIQADRTYAEPVMRVARGETVTIDLESGEIVRSLGPRITPPSQRPSTATALDAVDRALTRACDVASDSRRLGLLFSGGVDSTLLLSYLIGRAAPVTWVPDTPEFADETEYARSAARIAKVELDEAPVREDDYPRLLADTTELLGIPCMHYATPMFGAGYDKPYDGFFMGEGADSVFGLGMRLTQTARWLANPVAAALLAKVKDIGSGRLEYRLGQLHDGASRLRLAPGPRSFALGYAGSRFADEVGAVLGMERVLASLQSRLDFVGQRVEFEAPRTAYALRNIEVRHWISTTMGPAYLERHQAQGRGKAFYNIYFDPDVVAAAAAVPLSNRYVKRLRGKWMLKELLARRLPGYPVNQRKGPTGLPFNRLYESGSLRGIWDRYEVPDVFRGRHRDAVVKGNSMTWRALTYAVWEAHVASNPSLVPHPPAASVAFP